MAFLTHFIESSVSGDGAVQLAADLGRKNYSQFGTQALLFRRTIRTPRFGEPQRSWCRCEPQRAAGDDGA
jgi:hypothetical protein